MNPGAPSGTPDPMIGQLLDGRYQILHKLGEGGMGEVYAAQHVRLGKAVAIKLLRHEIVSNLEAVKRFEQEAKSASSIGHRNIIGILDSGELPDGRIYLSMELLEGAPLNELIKQPLPPERLLNILIQTGHGLAAAHKSNIVHRDMKPENIYVTFTSEGDVPKLLDFGIAKMTGNEGNNHLTKTGTIFGTPFYMAPEQALGQNVDQRADIYAMGVIMYEIFTGAVPFAGESFMAILTQHITSEPKPPSRMAADNGRGMPPGIEEIIVRAMKKEPDQRYQTMDELVAALVTVYRGLAGSGMSSYLPAMPGAGPSQLMAAAPAPTPMPYGPGGGHGPTGPQPQHHGSAPYHAQPAVTPYPGQSATFEPPPRSKTGLIVALVVLLLGGGGAAVAFVLMNDKKGDEVAGGGAGSSGASGGTNGTSGGGAAGQGGGTSEPTAPTDAGAVAVARPADAGAVAVDPPVDAGAVVVATPVTVLVNSNPPGAEVYHNGKKLPKKTPFMFKVTPGQPVELTFKKKRYKDSVVTLDGTTETVAPSLSKIASGNGGGNGGGEGGGDKPDDDPCKKTPRPAFCDLE
jgi:eukaryotic-like serine/threonine-protein kinase